MRKFLDIQLFAAPDVTATATFAKRLTETEAHKYYDMTLKDAIYDNYNFFKYFETVTQPQNKGKKMGFRRRSKYVLNSSTTNGEVAEIVENALPGEDTPMSTYEYELTLKNFGGYISYSDQLDIYSIDSGESTALQRNQGYAVGDLFQEKAYNILTSTTNHWFMGVTDFSTNNTVAKARAAATKIDLSQFGKIKTFLKRNNVKPWDGGDYLVVVAPEVEEDLKSLTKTADGGTYTLTEVAMAMQDGKPLYDGELGRWNGFRFVTDNGIKEIDTTNHIYGCLILGKYNGEKGAKLCKLEGYGEPKSILHAPGSAGSNDPLDQKGTIGWKCMGWGGMVVDPEAVMLLEVKASANTEDTFAEKEKAAYVTGYAADGTAIAADHKTVMNGSTKI